MTKKPLPIIAALLLTMTAHAQTADEHHSLTLGDGQTWTVPDATKPSAAPNPPAACHPNIH